MKRLLTIVLFTLLIGNGALGQSDGLTMIPDDYPVTDSMFKGNYDKIISGEITSLDKAWFTNDTLKQTLVFELYTDYHRLEIYHFYNNDIPEELINKIELYVSKGKFNNIFDTATRKQKQTFFSGFLSSGKKIDQKYFTTYKGFKLGDNQEKAITIYGTPDKHSTFKNIEKYEWTFTGDYALKESKTNVKTNKPLAKNSWGFEVIMFFRKDKLIDMILSNDIP